MSKDECLIPLSALQHYVFCPRQCALIHNEQQWAENYLTTHGQLLHQRVDKGKPESRKGVRFERDVQVSAPKLGITGKLDLVERDLSSGQLMPVEYKRGRPKKDNSDTVQLCAQVLCLEEMTGQSIEQAALWYWQTRHRNLVPIDSGIRQATYDVIGSVRALFNSGVTPPVKLTKGCKACSLAEFCLPELVQRDMSVGYVTELFSTKDKA